MCRMIFVHNASYDDCIQAASAMEHMAQYGMVPKGYKPGHHDGWGMVGFENGAVRRYARSVLSAARDEQWKHAAAALCKKSTNHNMAVMMHVRKGSVGDACLSNTHPFVVGKFAFCHNGTIDDHDKLLSSHASIQWLRRGTTDSEAFFLLLMQKIMKELLVDVDAHCAVRRAISLVMHTVHNEIQYKGLNFFLSDGHTIWAVRDYHEQYAQEHYLEEYYTLFHAQRSNTHYFSSEKYDNDTLTWTLLPNHHLVEINKNGDIYKEDLYI